MKYFNELLSELKQGKIAPVYLFYGEETYLREQALAHFQKYFAKDETSGLNCTLIDGETVQPAELVAQAETLPFFSDKRLVIVKNPPFFKSKRTSTAVAETEEEVKVPEKEQLLLRYLEDPSSSTCLILTTGEPVDKRKKIFRIIKESGQAINFTFLKKGELRRWLAQKTAALGIKFETEAADIFLHTAGPALQNLVMELDKLCHFTAERKVISQADVRQVCTPGVEDNIFTIVDAIGNKRCGEALNGIKEMLAAKEPPLRLLAMVSRQFRLLLQVSDLAGQGYAAQEIFHRLKIHPYVYQKIVGQSRNFDQKLLVNAFVSLSALETAVKAGRQEFYPALETYLIKLCLNKTLL